MVRGVTRQPGDQEHCSWSGDGQGQRRRRMWRSIQDQELRLEGGTYGERCDQVTRRPGALLLVWGWTGPEEEVDVKK